MSYCSVQNLHNFKSQGLLKNYLCSNFSKHKHFMPATKNFYMQAELRICFLALFFIISSPIIAQETALKDTIKSKTLDSVLINSSRRLNHTSFLPQTADMHIYAGKHTNHVIPDAGTSNLAGNISRMALAQIPGLTLWDMSGSGGQFNIGTRGTDPHRSIEMNMRQNGFNVNSDMFGYPEAHYTPPMQGVDKIELIRGSAALQFGPQFGGMMNFVMKSADTTRLLSIETEQTLGSFNFFNSYNAVNGRKGKWSYYAYYDNRRGDGWRKAAAFVYHAYYANIGYQICANSSLSLQFSRMDYREQIAGGLTDAQFAADARQSLRTRNFFSPFINIPALQFDSKLSSRSKVQVMAHYLGGERNSVQFLNPPTIPDTVNLGTGMYNPRQVDRDYYNGFTLEARYLHEYMLGKIKSTLSAGIRFFDQTTKRRQKGLGSSGSDFDLSLTKDYGIELRLHSANVACFAENIFRVGPKLTITPGFRYEHIATKMSGLITNQTVSVNYRSTRDFPLFGTGLEYMLSRKTSLYGNISQAYRPFLYANVTPADRIDVIDPDLKDSKGYDADLGIRGQASDILRFDINGFYMFYGNRVGQLTVQNNSGDNYLYTTNTGDALSTGLEAYVSFSFAKFIIPGYKEKLYRLRLFNSFSYTHGRYLNGSITKSGVNTPLKGNRLENIPDITNRTGLAWQHKNLVAQILYTYVGNSFSDANNTLFNPNGATGKVPSYQLLDFSFNWKFLNHYTISGGINNLLNHSYFTRRINMYPGPGILPGDGRSFYLSLGLHL